MTGVFLRQLSLFEITAEKVHFYSAENIKINSLFEIEIGHVFAPFPRSYLESAIYVIFSR